MNSTHWRRLAVVVAWTTHTSQAVVRYVDVNGTNATPPFTNWFSAAVTIQDAIDAADPGDAILVTNGVYQTGGRAVYGLMTNRVAVDKPLMLRSVNGPRLTVIQGRQVPGTINGDEAIRCAYLTNGASISGFTLTNGATRKWLDNRERSGGGVWCEPSAVVSNCVIVGNNADEYGGGAYSGSLFNCALSGNSAASGGGASGDLSKALRVNLYGCTVIGNSAQGAGGVLQGAVTNCIVYFNNAVSYPNCHYYGADAISYSCTTPLPPSGVGNIDLDPGLADAWHLRSDSPCRGAGAAIHASGVDIDGEPWANPPSIGCDEYSTGAELGALSVSLVASYTNVAVDFTVIFSAQITGISTGSVWDFGDGMLVTNLPYSGELSASHSWRSPGDYAPVLRAYNQGYPGGISATQVVQVVAPPVHFVSPSNLTPVPPYSSWATAANSIQDAVDAASPIPGTWVMVSNGIFATGGRAVEGTMTNRVTVDKPLVVRSVNGPQFSFIQGRQVPGTINGDGAIRCVYLTNGARLSGFTLTYGATQSAPFFLPGPVTTGGGLRCEATDAVVSNCVVSGNSAAQAGGGAYGGTLYDCTLSSNSVPAPYSAGGGGAFNSTLLHCVLFGNTSAMDGGGVMGGILTGCILTGNSAGEDGGGAYGSTLNNCVVNSNSAYFGGGAEACTLKNCTVISNSAREGGGVFQCTLFNSIICLNTAPWGLDYIYSTLNSCSTFWPNFVNADAGNFHLQADSPAINAGRNDYVSGSTDLDGNRRIVSGTVDLGAYEFIPPDVVLFNEWLAQYGLPIDGSADFIDIDGDGMNNSQEWIAGTIPTNSFSVLRLTTVSRTASGLDVTWQSVATRHYFLERSTNLNSVPTFWTLATNLPSGDGTTTYTDNAALGSGPFFYRVGVQP